MKLIEVFGNVCLPSLITFHQLPRTYERMPKSPLTKFLGKVAQSLW